MSNTTPRRTVLSARDISKSYGPTLALSHADFDLYAGEVHALVGANGAGKSTLVRILSGSERPDAGSTRYGDREVLPESPAAAHELGVRTIFQDPGVVPTLDACANVLLGEENARLGLLRTREQRSDAQVLLRDLGFEASMSAPAGTLRPADLQLIELAKALHSSASVIVMDEPTAALGMAEREHMLSVVSGLRDRGVGVLYIAHDLDEVLAVSDRVTVMRDGRTFETLDSARTTPTALVQLMVGSHLALLERESSHPGEEVLVLEGVGQGGQLQGINLSCRAGEILGITGLVGSGRTRLLNVIAGLERATEGSMRLDGAPYQPTSPRDALSRSIALVPENRKQDSLLMDLPSTESIMISAPISRSGMLRRAMERRKAKSWMGTLRVKPADPGVPPASMSGGNQQKVSIAKALQTNARVLMLDEPGQGVDIAAKDQIFRSVRSLAGEGRAVLIVSSELAELAPLVDRLVVMRRGRISGVLDANEISECRVLELASTNSPPHAPPVPALAEGIS